MPNLHPVPLDHETQDEELLRQALEVEGQTDYSLSTLSPGVFTSKSDTYSVDGKVLEAHNDDA